MHRRLHLKTLALSALASATGSAVMAQSGYPDKPIRLIVQFPPGSVIDSLARISAEHLQDRLKQTVVVENRPGAGGNIAAAEVARSPADGYTLLFGQNGLAWAPWLFNNLKFDPMALASVSIVSGVPFVCTVKKDLPVKTVIELRDYARANPDKLTCATSGIGSPQHLLAELFMNKTGTKMTTVPYKGTAAIMPDFVDGRIDVLFSAAEGVLPHIKTGKLRGLAIVGDKRLAALPDVPTLAETGLGVDAGGFWVGIYAPPGTPAAITKRLSDELQLIKNNPALVERIAATGNLLQLSTPAEMTVAMKRDNERWGEVIKAANIKLE